MAVTDVFTADLLNTVTTTGTPTRVWSRSGVNPSTGLFKVNLTGAAQFSVFAKDGTGGSTPSLTFTIEGTSDPNGAYGWTALAFRTVSSGSYSAAAVSPSESGATYYFDPADMPAWIRLNVTVNDSTGAIVRVTAA